MKTFLSSMMTFLKKTGIIQLLTFGFKLINYVLRKITFLTHGMQFALQWIGRPTPEWFDHNLNVYFGLSAFREPYWMERGVFNLMAMKPGAELLELCCGDGFYSRHFYSKRASTIVSVDFDKSALLQARLFNKSKNVTFHESDIRKDIPAGPFDNVVWDAAIEHFTEEETQAILKNIKLRLKKGGILGGYTNLEQESGKKSLEQHEHEFKSKEELARLLKKHFKNVEVFQTDYPSRKNLYFWASDSNIPFAPGWDHIYKSKV